MGEIKKNGFIDYRKTEGDEGINAACNKAV